MPCKSVKCSQCGKRIRIGSDGKLPSIRRHYKRKHPEMMAKWKRGKKK